MPRRKLAPVILAATALAFAAVQFLTGWAVLGCVGNGATMGRPEADTILFFTGAGFVIFSPVTLICALCIGLRD